MIRLATSPAATQEMGRVGRRKVAEQFDWEVKVDRVLDLYQGVLPSRAA